MSFSYVVSELENIRKQVKSGVSLLDFEDRKDFQLLSVISTIDSQAAGCINVIEDEKKKPVKSELDYGDRVWVKGECVEATVTGIAGGRFDNGLPHYSLRQRSDQLYSGRLDMVAWHDREDLVKLRHRGEKR